LFLGCMSSGLLRFSHEDIIDFDIGAHGPHKSLGRVYQCMILYTFGARPTARRERRMASEHPGASGEWEREGPVLLLLGPVFNRQPRTGRRAFNSSSGAAFVACLTPGPPPFSSMNSTPSASKACRVARCQGRKTVECYGFVALDLASRGAAARQCDCGQPSRIRRRPLKSANAERSLTFFLVSLS
jgi:hypothetical protein